MLDGFEFIDLQYTDTSKERNDFFERFGKKILKIDGKDYFNDIEGLTSTIDACDLILSISNINAHLSGAILKNTFNASERKRKLCIGRTMITTVII